MNETVPDQLINALRDVADLDHLHQLLINEHTDRFTSPQFNAWLIELLNAERGRRETQERETDWPWHDFWSWPPAFLTQAAVLSLCYVEATAIQGEPTSLNFTLRLCELLMGGVCLALLNREQARYAPQTN